MRRQLAALVFALVLPLPTLAAEVVIQPGETLSEIAARAGISTQRLMQLNGLRDADRIVAGQRLTVPGAPQRAGGGQREAASAGGRITVRQGETLSEIAEHHGVSVERLMQWNGITDPTRLVAGDRLIVRAPLSNRQEGSGGGAGRGGGTTVTVRPGDTLSDIADRYNVPLERLIQLNRVQNPSQVMAGEKLLISTRPPTRPQRPGPSGQTSAGARVHVVQPGETLSDIATDYKVPMERLVSLNRLKDPDELLAGTELRLIPPPPVPRSTPRTTPRPKPGGKAPTVARSTPTRPTTTTAPARSDATTATATAVTRRTAPTTVAGTASSPTKTSASTAGSTSAGAAVTTATTTAATAATVAAESTVATARVPATTTVRKDNEAARTTSPAATTTSTPAVTGTNASTDGVATGSTATSTTATSATSTTTSAASRTTTAATKAAADTPATAPTTRAAGSTTAAAATTTTPTASSAVGTTRRSSPTTTGSSSAATRVAAEAAATLATTRAADTSTAATKSTGDTTTTVATASQRPTGITTATTPRSTARTRAVAADWRTYGPMQVDWSSWQTMGGSYVAPVLTSSGQPFYLAINCGARKLNTTGVSGQWKTWDAPQTEFEQSLVTDLCRLKGG